MIRGDMLSSTDRLVWHKLWRLTDGGPATRQHVTLQGAKLLVAGAKKASSRCGDEFMNDAKRCAFPQTGSHPADALTHTLTLSREAAALAEPSEQSSPEPPA